MLKGKNILIGITGGIAAYKAAILIRQLVKEGANVKCMMTPMAKEFVTPLTLATLSKNPILTDFYNPENGDWNSHVDLGIWANLYIIAPATANSMGKMANGIADNLLLTTYLSSRCPVLVAPTMDLDMYQHPTTSKNINTLVSHGCHIVEPNSGELASGLVGKGRMAEPEEIVDAAKTIFLNEEHPYFNKLKDKTVLITSGPTHEKIDPVRYIGNHSTGKMGSYIAKQCAKFGAIIIFIAGPDSVIPDGLNIEVIKVTSAHEMHKKALDNFSKSDIAIFAAAVCDYTVKETASQKLKSGDSDLSIELMATKDIAQELGAIKTDKQITIGFALETENEIENAKKKIKKKNFDFIVLNSLNDSNAGFGFDTNKVTIIDKENIEYPFELKSKEDVATDIIEKLVALV